MAKLRRIRGNVTPFAAGSGPQERTIFGQYEISDDINRQITSEFVRGWGEVGPNEFPSLQDFNALGFTLSNLISYLYQNGVAEYDPGASYYERSVTQYLGEIFIAKVDNPIGAPEKGSTDWGLIGSEKLLMGAVQKEAGKGLYPNADAEKLGSIGDGTQTRKGLVRFATNAEIDAGVVTNVALDVVGAKRLIGESDFARILTPRNITPAEGALNVDLQPTLVGTPYSPLYSVDVRNYREFQVTTSEDSSFSNVVFEAQDNVDEMKVTTDLELDTSYIWRQRDVSVGGYESSWSIPTTFSSGSRAIKTPQIIVPDEGQTNIPERPEFMLSLFEVVGGSDTLVSSRFRVRNSAGSIIHTSEIIASGDLDRYTLPAGILQDGSTSYSVEGQYRGSALGWSSWSDPVSFVTEPRFIYVDAPTVVYPAQGAVDITDGPTIELSPFSVHGGSDTLTGSRVRVRDSSSAVIYTSDIVASGDISKVTIPEGVLEDGGKTFSVEGQYRGDTQGWSDWGAANTFTTIASFIRIEKPSIVEPEEGETDVPESPVIRLSDFAVIGGSDVADASRFRVRNASGTVIHTSPTLTDGDLSEYALPAGVLEEGGKTFKVEGQYRGAVLGWSDYSDLVSFTTEASFLPDEPGAPFGGGFMAAYYTMGGKTHLLITADKSSEQSLQWKTARTNTSGTDSDIDGAANTAAMITAGKAAHPAAAACVDWRGGGFSDWFLPAKNQRELEYSNLKPFTQSNHTSSGINPNAIPPRPSNYTASVPAQTSIPAFKKGGAQAFNDDGGTSMYYYWTSTQTSTTTARYQSFDVGTQSYTNKDYSRRVRPVRSLEIN